MGGRGVTGVVSSVKGCVGGWMRGGCVWSGSSSARKYSINEKKEGIEITGCFACREDGQIVMQPDEIDPRAFR